MTRKILLVDDNPDDIEALERAVRRNSGFVGSTLSAQDGTECLTALERHPDIACVLLDFSLPGRNGLMVLSQILDKFPALPIVMITGQGNEEIAVEAMRLGAQDYVSKDALTPKGLRRAVHNAIERAGMADKIREQRESLLSFSHILVHDLRSPLRSIKTAIEWLMEDLPDDITREHSKTLEFVTEGARRMDDLIKALQVYNEVEKGASQSKAVDLDKIVASLRSALMTDLDERNGQIVTDGSLSNIVGNPILISQLLQNLIGNGLKYNRSDSPEIRIRMFEDLRAWRLEISDNGIGIEDKFLQKIFEPFKRCHSSKEFEGTGLGLATCKKIVERHGGELSCKSQVGQGSTFIIKLPKPSVDESEAA